MALPIASYSLYRRNTASGFSLTRLTAAVCVTLIVVGSVSDFVGAPPAASLDDMGFFTAPRVFMKDRHGVNIFTTDTHPDGRTGVLKYIGLGKPGSEKELILEGEVHLGKQCSGKSNAYQVQIHTRHKDEKIRYQVWVDKRGKTRQKKLGDDHGKHPDDKYLDIGNGKMVFILWNAECVPAESSKQPPYAVEAEDSTNSKNIATMLYHWHEIDSLWHGTVEIDFFDEIYLSLNPEINHGGKEAKKGKRKTSNRTEQDSWEFHIIPHGSKHVEDVKNHIHDAAAKDTHMQRDGHGANGSDP